MPLSPEKIRSLTHIVTHENCADGVASAMILKEVLPGARVTFVNYNSKLQALPAEPGMIFCDCTPHRERIDDFLKVGAVVLDHHKTARNITDRFVAEGLGVYADEAKDLGVCGAVLAFREVWMPMKDYMGEGEYKDAYERLATLAGIRDTWQKNDPRWREACEQADSLTFWPWDYIEKKAWDAWPTILSIGPVLFDRNIRRVDKAIEGAYRFTSKKGRKVVVFEGTKPTSDASEKLASEADIVVGFSLFVEEGKPKIIFSTRSRSDFDCSAFCLANGGGGHTKAAGFSCFLMPEDLQPFTQFERILNLYETFEFSWLALVQFERDQSKVDSNYKSELLLNPVAHAKALKKLRWPIISYQQEMTKVQIFLHNPTGTEVAEDLQKKLGMVEGDYDYRGLLLGMVPQEGLDLLPSIEGITYEVGYTQPASTFGG